MPDEWTVSTLKMQGLEWRVWSERAILVIKGFKMGFRRLRKLPKPTLAAK